MRILKTKKNFRKELKRQLRYAIAAAVGFLVIFAWRDSILSATSSLVEKIEQTTSVAASSIATALFITMIGVIIILISSKLLKD